MEADIVALMSASILQICKNNIGTLTYAGRYDPSYMVSVYLKGNGVPTLAKSILELVMQLLYITTD